MVKEIKKSMQDLKVGIEAIKKTETGRILEMENLGKITGQQTTDASITNRIEEMEVRISGTEDYIGHNYQRTRPSTILWS